MQRQHQEDIEAVESAHPWIVRGWSIYNLHLEKWPLQVKSVTAFFLLALADATAQGVEAFERKRNGFDVLRTLRFGVLALLGTPWSHYYFDLLDTFLPPTESPWTGITFLKLFIDQCIQAPLLLGVIIMVLHAMEGQGLQGIQQDLKLHYWNTLVTNWCLWIPASFVNLAFVRPTLRVLYQNVVFFLWTIILSVMLNTP